MSNSDFDGVEANIERIKEIRKYQDTQLNNYYTEENKIINSERFERFRQKQININNTASDYIFMNWKDF